MYLFIYWRKKKSWPGMKKSTRTDLKKRISALCGLTGCNLNSITLGFTMHSSTSTNVKHVKCLLLLVEFAVDNLWSILSVSVHNKTYCRPSNLIFYQKHLFSWVEWQTVINRIIRMTGYFYVSHLHNVENHSCYSI